MSQIGDNGGPEFDWRDYGGFIVEARDSRDHAIIGYGKQVKPCDPERGFCFSVNEAWRDLLHECRFRDGYVMNGGRKMLIERGSLVGAVSWLANRWNWTPKTVRGFLEKLENDGMIERVQPGLEQGQQKGKQAQVLRVCNYSLFNPERDTEGQAKGPAEGKQGASKGQAEGNNIKKNNVTMEQDNPPSPQGGRPKYRDVAKQAFKEFADLAGRCGLPVPREASFTDARAKAILARMSEHAGANATPEAMLEVWRLALRNIERSRFLRGGNDKGFRADLTFLTQAKSFARLIEGGYGNGATVAPVMQADNRPASVIRDEIAARLAENGYAFIGGDQ